MKYILIYDNPSRPYIIGFEHSTWELAMQHLAKCKARGMLDSDFKIVTESDPQAIWLRDNKHLF